MFSIKPIKRTKILWSDDELSILKKYYALGGSLLCKEKGLIRSQSAITNKAFKLNLKYNNSIFWSEDEINLLKEHYTKGISHLKKLGINKSNNSIKVKAKELNLIKYSNWTDEEIAILKEHYKEGVYMLREKGLNKSKNAIYCKASRLGLSNYNYKFTPEDIALIEKYYSIGGSRLVRLRGLDISDDIINNKANSLGLIRYDEYNPNTNGWGINDIDIFLDYYIVGGFELCKEKGLTKSKISAMAKADQLKIKTFSKFEVDVALDTGLTFNEKLELIGSTRSIHEIKYVSKYKV